MRFDVIENSVECFVFKVFFFFFFFWKHGGENGFETKNSIF